MGDITVSRPRQNTYSSSVLASFTPEIHTLLRAEAERRGISVRALIRLYVRVGIDCDIEIRAKREAALRYEPRCDCKKR